MKQFAIAPFAPKSVFHDTSVTSCRPHIRVKGFTGITYFYGWQNRRQQAGYQSGEPPQWQ